MTGASAEEFEIECEDPMSANDTLSVMVELPVRSMDEIPSILHVDVKPTSCVLVVDHYRITVKLMVFHGNSKNHLYQALPAAK